MDTNSMVMTPVMIFFVVGIMYFNVYSLSGSQWYNMMFMSFPSPPTVEWLGILNALVYVAYAPIWIGIVILKIIGTLGVLGTILTIPFSMMVAYPITAFFFIPLTFMLALGLIMKIRVAASGLSGE